MEDEKAALEWTSPNGSGDYKCGSRFLCAISCMNMGRSPEARKKSTVPPDNYFRLTPKTICMHL